MSVSRCERVMATISGIRVYHVRTTDNVRNHLLVGGLCGRPCETGSALVPLAAPQRTQSIEVSRGVSRQTYQVGSNLT